MRTLFNQYKIKYSCEVHSAVCNALFMWTWTSVLSHILVSVTVPAASSTVSAQIGQRPCKNNCWPNVDQVKQLAARTNRAQTASLQPYIAPSSENTLQSVQGRAYDRHPISSSIEQHRCKCFNTHEALASCWKLCKLQCLCQARGSWSHAGRGSYGSAPRRM